MPFLNLSAVALEYGTYRTELSPGIYRLEDANFSGDQSWGIAYSKDHNTFVWQPFVVPAESTEIHPRTCPLWGVGGGTGTSGSTGACPASQTSVDANQCFNINILNSFNTNSNNKDSVISITTILAPASTTTVTFYSTITAPCTTFITQIINNFCTTICNNCEFLRVTAP
jgi:hypothetical protein